VIKKITKSKGEKPIFTAAQVRKILASAESQMKAMISLFANF
jgi:hypothetical protein